MNGFTRVTRGATGVLRWVWAIPQRVRLANDTWEETAAQARTIQGPSVRERQADLIQFYSRFENLVEALCDSGQYGPVERLERRYAQERQWMQANYPKVRKYVVAYLRFDALDAEHCSTLDGSFGDAFEALFAAPSLECFLTMDDGHMISRITRTREALNLYGEHLRQLLARDASCD